MHKDELHLAYRCETNFEAMPVAEPGARRCESCQLNVHDLTHRTEAEVREVLADSVRTKRRLCIHYKVRRATGEVMLAASLLAATPAFAAGNVPTMPVADPVAEVPPDTGNTPAPTDTPDTSGTDPDGGPTDEPTTPTDEPVEPVPEEPEFVQYDGFYG